MNKTTSIYLATPCFGGQAFTNYITSLLALQRACNDRRIGLQVKLHGGDALISRARGRMAGDFLDNTAHSHLLFVDADIGFKPEQVFRLLESERGVVGGVYPAKKIDWERARRAFQAGQVDIEGASLSYVVRFPPSPTNSVEVADDGFGAVAYVGTGFLMIKREALQQLDKAYPNLRALHRDIGGGDASAPMLFDTLIDPESGQYLSEDYAFCHRWRAIGGEVFADFTGRFSHVGHREYNGGLEVARLAPHTPTE